MKTSITTDNISKALVKFSASAPTVLKDKANTFFNSNYSTLDSVLSAVREPLAACGLAITQFIVSDDKRVGICTRLVHESGEWLEDTIVSDVIVGKGQTLPQAIGVMTTYMRRYAISAVLNITSEDDVDGEMGEREYERPAKYVSKKPKTKSAKRHVPVEEEGTEGEEGPSLDDLADEFGHAYNKCVALGNPEEDLPKLPKKSTWTEEILLQKIAEINLILKASEEE